VNGKDADGNIPNAFNMDGDEDIERIGTNVLLIIASYSLICFFINSKAKGSPFLKFP